MCVFVCASLNQSILVIRLRIDTSVVIPGQHFSILQHVVVEIDVVGGDVVVRSCINVVVF